MSNAHDDHDGLDCGFLDRRLQSPTLNASILGIHQWMTTLAWSRTTFMHHLYTTIITITLIVQMAQDRKPIPGHEMRGGSYSSEWSCNTNSDYGWTLGVHWAGMNLYNVAAFGLMITLWQVLLDALNFQIKLHHPFRAIRGVLRLLTVCLQACCVG